MGAINSLNRKCVQICCPSKEEKKEESPVPRISSKKKVFARNNNIINSVGENSENLIFHGKKEIFPDIDNNEIKEEINNQNNINQKQSQNQIEVSFNSSFAKISGIIITNDKLKETEDEIQKSKKVNNNCNRPTAFNTIDSNDIIFRVLIIQRKFRIFMKKQKDKEISLFNELNKINHLAQTKNKNSRNYQVTKGSESNKEGKILFVSEETFGSLKIKSNIFSLDSIQLFTSGENENDKIKGNFLMKKKKFKFNGKKDSNGKKNGFGKIIWEDMSILKGYFTSSRINGFVYFKNISEENSSFQGEYEENIPKGYGFYSKIGYSLEGKDWYKNSLNGIGIAMWEEGESYEGEIKNCIKEGIGTYRWVDGSEYMGEFQKNKINGFGSMYFANGNIYEGEFSDGFLTGWGKFIWEDGKYYMGNYLKDKKHGFGIFVWKEEPLIAIIGFWENGNQHGLCLKLAQGHLKAFYIKGPNNFLSIHHHLELKMFLLPSQAKYRPFFSKMYDDYARFIKFASRGF